MPDIKELLISPFSLVPSASNPSASNPSASNPSASNPSKKKAYQRPFQQCKCDSDNEDNDFGMAPECAFICSLAQNKTTKKRKHASPRMKKTRRSATHQNV